MSKAKFVTHADAMKSGLKFRVSSWIDTDEMNEHFGVEAQMKPNVWCHVAVPEGSAFKVWLFPDEVKANKSIEGMKQMQAEAKAATERKASAA